MLVSLVAIVNPIGTAPLFVGMTEDYTPAERSKLAQLASITCLAVLLVVATFGQAILSLFGISVASFRVIGGIVFLLMAIDMLNVRPSRTRVTPEEESECVDRRQIGFVPLGVPMLAGPGAISTVLLYGNEGSGVMWRAVVYAVVVASCVITWVVLASAGPLSRVLGTTGTNILTRLMGLVVGAIGAESLAAGLKALMPGLGS